jgi:enolase
MACARASARSRGEPLFAAINRLWNDRLGPGDSAGPALPMPVVSMISANRLRDQPIDFQTFLMVPLRARSFSEAMEMVADLHRCLAEVLIDYGESQALFADDGGYAPILRADGHAIEQILESGLRCGLRMGEDVAVALDVAANRHHDRPSGLYHLPGSGEALDSDGMIGLVEHWARQYPIVSVEDPLADDDWEGWTALTARLGSALQVVADDLFASRADRLERGASRGAANALLVKPDLCGTLSDALDLLASARRLGYRAVLSARSGETEDTSLADLAVGAGCGEIKVGAIARSERLAKYNRLLRIEELLGGPSSAPFADRSALHLRQPEPSHAS